MNQTRHVFLSSIKTHALWRVIHDLSGDKRLNIENIEVCAAKVACLYTISLYDHRHRKLAATLRETQGVTRKNTLERLALGRPHSA